MKLELSLVCTLILFSISTSVVCAGNAVISDPEYAQRELIVLPDTSAVDTVEPPGKSIAAMGARAGRQGAADWTVGVVGAGGALGASTRYLISDWTGTVNWFGYDLPMGTLAVNVLGSLGIGMMTGWAGVNDSINPTWPALISVGFLGGLTTFSAFSQETVILAEQAGSLAATSYVAVSVLSSIGAVLVGQQLGVWLMPIIFL